MQKLCSLLSLVLVLFSCSKNNTSSQNSCDNLSGKIEGHWYLTAVRNYSFLSFTDTTWIPVDTTNKVIIEFSDDSVFSYNNNYPLPMNNYNRYSKIDSVNFRIYSNDPPVGGNFPEYPSIPVIMITANEIELIYMGVDYGKIEKYMYSCSN